MAEGSAFASERSRRHSPTGNASSAQQVHSALRAETCPWRALRRSPRAQLGQHVVCPADCQLSERPLPGASVGWLNDHYAGALPSARGTDGRTAANDPIPAVGISDSAWQSKPMVNTYALFQIGDAAEEAGDFARAHSAFERGAALGDVACLSRLAYLFDTGKGVEIDKAVAMRLYQRAWRNEHGTVAGSNIAILYRERKQWQQMFRWWQRVAATGDGSAQLEMAKCYLRGRGVKRDIQAALRCLASAEGSVYISEYERDLAGRLRRKLRPRAVSIGET